MLTRLVSILLFVGALAWCCSAALGAEGAHGSTPQAEAAEGHGGGEHPVDLNPMKTLKADLALWSFVVFLVLLAILGKYAWGPIADGLEQREQRVHGEIAAAEKANLDAKQLLAEYQQRLAASEGEVREILERARRDAEQLGRQMLDKARAETEAEKERAVREIETATSGAIKELAERSASLAVELAGKIVRTKLDPNEHTRLIEDAMSRFATTKTNGG